MCTIANQYGEMSMRGALRRLCSQKPVRDVAGAVCYRPSPAGDDDHPSARGIRMHLSIEKRNELALRLHLFCRVSLLEGELIAFRDEGIARDRVHMFAALMCRHGGRADMCLSLSGDAALLVCLMGEAFRPSSRVARPVHMRGCKRTHQFEPVRIR
ncbi:hypothetical protein ATB93_10995 [Sphingomonas sp. WG]|nr:hypothetical protein ATB93_10995 [Sphingomonas sp. WG]